MQTGYVIRHQHQGFIHDHVFIGKPTQAQLDEVLAELSRRHGPCYPYPPLERVLDAATGEVISDPGAGKGWYRVEEINLYDVHDVPVIAADPNQGVGMTAPQFSVSGTGTVEGP